MSVDIIEKLWVNNKGFHLHVQGHANIVRLLLAQPQIDVSKGRSVDGATALTMASCTGNVDIVRSLLGNSQTDVNQGTHRISMRHG